MEFVSFEIAKKLKEKGFDRPCIYAYCEAGGWNKYKQVQMPITHILRTNGNPFGTFYTGKNWNREYEINENKIRCSAPTISQVLNWLEVEKQIYILVEPFPSMATKDKVCWSWHFKWNSDGVNIDHTFSDDFTYLTSKEATLAAIEYTLDKLI